MKKQKHFSLNDKQVKWLERYAEKHYMTASQIISRLIDEEMSRSKVQATRILLQKNGSRSGAVLDDAPDTRGRD